MLIVYACMYACVFHSEIIVVFDAYPCSLNLNFTVSLTEDFSFKCRNSPRKNVFLFACLPSYFLCQFLKHQHDCHFSLW